MLLASKKGFHRFPDHVFFPSTKSAVSDDNTWAKLIKTAYAS
jgi:hypothetical protein